MGVFPRRSIMSQYPHVRHFRRTPRASTALRTWIRQVEGGSSGGDDFAFVTYGPFLLSILLIGLCFAMIGFWRIGASYATQRGAQVGSVRPSAAGAAQTSFFVDWTNAGSAPPSNFAFNPGDRTSTSSLNSTKEFHSYTFGDWSFSVNAQTQTRNERFYPGAPICDGDGCDE
jgi:hypothetical protein